MNSNLTTESVDTHNKALKVNLDAQWYGTFAEIGAGQEVVRWFFRVGGAAGTIAKSISAYDMKVSDAIYGRSERYVSKGRLQAMLDRELELNIERLGGARGDTTAFFAFADTVVARSFKGTNECHGWMGIKFQSRPHDQPSQILMHVRMLDAEASLQQEALGIVGVNLCYGAFFLHHMPERLVESLLHMLTIGRIEIDMIQFSGIEFRNVDNRVMALQLVQLGLSGAAMFGADREVLQPTEVLYKKAVLVERGSFRPTTNVNLDMVACALAKFKADPAVADKPILEVVFDYENRNECGKFSGSADEAGAGAAESGEAFNGTGPATRLKASVFNLRPSPPAHRFSSTITSDSPAYHGLHLRPASRHSLDRICT